MFDFEKLETYRKSKLLNIKIQRILRKRILDNITGDQLKRASLSIVLNIAEGTGRFTKPDRRNFYIRARGSLYECVSILGTLKDEKLIVESEYLVLYRNYEELSKMLLGLINS